MGNIQGISNAATSVAGIAGKLYTGYAAGAAYDRSADALRMESKYQRDRGLWMADRIRKKGKKFTGTQRAAMASQGMDPNSGSSLDVLADSVAEIELDALLAEHEGYTGAWRSDTQAGQNRLSAKNARRAGIIEAAGSVPKLLDGISKWSWKKK